MNFIKHISHLSFFATGAGARRLRQLPWIAVCALLAAAWAGPAQFNPRRAQAEQSPTLHGEAAVRQLKTDGSYSSLAAAMAAARYQINAAPAKFAPSGAPYFANNPGQQLRAAFASNEVRVSVASNQTPGKTDGAELRLQLAGYGYGDQLTAVTAGELTTEGNRIAITKSSIRNPQSAIEEWYVNKPEGLEQGFRLAAPPADERQGDWLRVALAVGEGWRASLRGDQQGVLFERRADGLRLNYDHLAASDAQGRTLPVRMAFDGGTLSLLVDDTQAVYPLTIDPILTQQQKLTAADGAARSQFGSAVAVSGDTVVVGADEDDIGVEGDEGSVYVFTRSFTTGGAVWTLQKKLTASDGAPGDFFGRAVALSGNTLVVGAFGGDTVASLNQGAAYVFTRSGTIWTQQQKLTASDGATNDVFGLSVALSGDTVVVGAPNDTIGANANQGSAYVFTRSGIIWTQQQKLTANDGAANDLFGLSVALSGETVIVGAPFDLNGANGDQGSAYVFTRSGTAWTQKQKLTASDSAPGDRFGISVALSGNTAVVGADDDDIGANGNQGSAYVFTRSFTTGGAIWTQQQKLTASDGTALDDFGISVAISGDTLVVGSHFDDIGTNGNQGSAYVFSRSGTIWTQQRKLTASDGESLDEFGFSVALSGDTVVVGAPLVDIGENSDQGAAYVFAIGENNHVQQQQLAANDGALGDQFGHSVAISGDTVVVGAYTDDIGLNTTQGSAYVFTRSFTAGGAVWTQQQKLTADVGVTNAQFGFSVAISGNTVVVGAPFDANGENLNRGSVYVFTRTGTVWTQQQKLTANDGGPGDFFGGSIALGGDTIVVGALGDNIGTNADQGSAYVFIRSGTIWTQQQKLTADDGAAGDRFGRSVALSGDTVVVGASNDAIGANVSQGSAYVFTRSAALWTQKQKLTANDGAAQDIFGFSVAISGDTVVVGAQFADIGVNKDQGSAYVFTLNGATWAQQQKLTANDGAASDLFGFSVALGGDTLVVGAVVDDIGEHEDQGSVYVFTRGGTVWTQQQRLTSNDGAAGDQFGGSVALSGETVVIGAASDDIGPNGNQGSAYVFVCPACPIVTLNPASLPDAQQGALYSQTVTASSAGGGTGPIQFSLSDGALPPGLVLAQNGVLSGTPNTVGAFSFTITATVPNSLCTGSRNYTLTVVTGVCPTVTLNPSTLPAGVSGVDYNQTVTASGGAAPYSFAVSAGTLPTGLSLAANGVLTGPPLVAGSFNFTVRATDANGCQGTRDYSLIINGGAANNGLQFYPLAHPIRLLDTRPGQPGCDAPGAQIPGGTSRTQTARGICDGTVIPTDARAITGNITTVESDGGFLTLYPSDAARPLVANSNYRPGEILNNVFTVGLGDADGAFKIFVNSNTHVVVDVTGYYGPPGAANAGGLYFHPLPKPIRLLETRPDQPGCTTPGVPLVGNTDTPQLARLTCDGVTIPAAAQAIVGNATTVSPAGPGFLTLFPASAARPLVANSNYDSNQIVNGPFTVGLSAVGEFNIFSSATTHLVVDVLGYYSAEANDGNGVGLLFNPLPAPVRLLDTRPGQTGCFTPGGPLPANTELSQTARGTCQGQTIPAAARAIVGNATVVNSNGGFLTLWPSNAAKPLVATSNFNPGQIFNRHFTVGLGPDGAFKMYSLLQTDLVIDVSGFFAP